MCSAGVPLGRWLELIKQLEVRRCSFEKGIEEVLSDFLLAPAYSFFPQAQLGRGESSRSPSEELMCPWRAPGVPVSSFFHYMIQFCWFCSCLIVSTRAMGFPGGSVVEKPPADAGDARDVGWIPGSGRPPGGGTGNPLQCSCLENPHGQWSLGGYSPWDLTESNTTGHTHTRAILF